MKKLIIISLLFLLSSLVYSAPNYDPNIKPIVYDVSYNVELRNFLEKEYYDKCYVQIAENHHNNICGINSFYEMVQNPYNLIKKSDEEGNLSNDSKKSKAELLKEIKGDIAYHNELMEKYNNTCGSGDELYRKKVEEIKKTAYFYLKDKIYQDMLKDGSLCSPTAHIDMVDKPFHEWRMQKLKNK